MSSNKRILYIGGGREAEETLQAAKSLGLEVLYIQRKEKFKDRLLPLVDQVVLFDYRDTEALVTLAKSLRTVFPYESAVSLSEDALVAAAEVREALGLPGNSLETVKLLKDKPLMRQYLNEIGFSPVAARVGSTREDMEAFVREQGLPIIVKPADGAGSFGVFRVDHVSQLDEIRGQLQELDVPVFLMEEYLDGIEISVETFTFHGRHVALTVTDKLLHEHVEIGHCVPAPVTDEEYDTAVEFVKKFLDVVKFREGPAHTELKLTSKGPRIIESHDRIGGDRLTEMVRTAYGIDFKQMALGWPCGLIQPLEDSPAPLGASAIRFLTPPPGIVREILGVDEVLQAEGLVELKIDIAVGERVNPLTESYDRVGWVIVGGKDKEEAIARCEELASRVQIITEP